MLLTDSPYKMKDLKVGIETKGFYGDHREQMFGIYTERSQSIPEFTHRKRHRSWAGDACAASGFGAPLLGWRLRSQLMNYLLGQYLTRDALLHFAAGAERSLVQY